MEVYRELRGTLNRIAPIRSYKPCGGGESYSDVAQRGVRSPPFGAAEFKAHAGLREGV